MLSTEGHCARVTVAPEAAVAPPATVSGDQATRTAFSAQLVGLNMVFFELQRAGLRPPDALETVPQAWAWKQEAFTGACASFAAQFMTAAEQSEANLAAFPGYFEAGSAPLPPVRLLSEGPAGRIVLLLSRVQVQSVLITCYPDTRLS